MTAPAETRACLAALLAGDLAFRTPAREAHPLHALHPFAARFPYGLAGRFIEGLTQPGATVLDPMCGSGITLLEGWLAGRAVIGVDLDPLARRQSAARTTAMSPEALREAGTAVLERAAVLRAGQCHPADPLAAVRSRMDDATRSFVDYWFWPETQQELAALKLAIAAEPDPRRRNLLEVVFSSTIVTKSGGVSRARDLAHTRPHRADKPRRSPLRQFEILLGRAVPAYASVAATGVGPSAVIAGDSRRLPVAAGSVDLIVTSPPYANALDYMRAHKFSLAWLGDPIPRLTKLRGRYIGAERRPDPSHRGPALPAPVQSVVDELAGRDVPKAGALSPLFRRYAACPRRDGENAATGRRGRHRGRPLGDARGDRAHPRLPGRTGRCRRLRRGGRRPAAPGPGPAHDAGSVAIARQCRR